METGSVTWVVMPVVTGRDMTMAAINDCLAQTIPTRVLVVGQGCEDSLRRELERVAEEQPDRVFCWWHNPPLPSLSATWNRALEFCWETGAEEALVINNDTRTSPWTLERLHNMRVLTHALFITAVGVTAEQYAVALTDPDKQWESDLRDKYGGPDFSCYLISKEGHEKYPFDEMFTPAFCEDLDTHRRYILGGDGDKIFSINLPYLHLSSQTLKQVSPEKRATLERAISHGSRAHYERKWGGSVNHERYTIPFEEASAQENVTTPDLQRATMQEIREVIG